MRLKLLAITLNSMVLIGCAGGPVGWGGTHQTLQASDKFVTYLYDPIVGGRSAAMNDAANHCRMYGKTAVPSMAQSQGILQIQTYECVSPQGNITNAQNQSDQLNKKMSSAFESVQKCNKELTESNAGRQITKSMLVLSDDQLNKYDLFSSKMKLNEQQRKLIASFLADQSKCRKPLIDAAAGTAYAIPISKRYADLDSLYVKFLSGQLTVGEANLGREQLFVKSRQEMAAAAKSIDDSLRSAHNAEIAQDKEERNRLAEAHRASQQNYQQQQIINQNQQLINNQILQSNFPKVNPTSQTSPIQTDCTRMGNFISCTSY
jgi:hypothetical protein